MLHRITLIFLVVAWFGADARAGDAGVPAAPRRPALFDRLGGKPAVTAVVDEMIRRVALDGRINARFLNSDMPRLRGNLIDLVCAVSGGPCRYGGKDMKTAHAGMNITPDDFDALVGDLKGALDHFKVPAKEQGDLLALLGPTKGDIVEVIPTASAGAGGRGGGAKAAGAPPAAATAVATSSPVVERAAALREAAVMLEKADTERQRGNRSLADQLFSFAELIVGVDAVAVLAPLFREGAPPRINTRLSAAKAGSAPQPATVGNSDEEEPPKPAKGWLSGVVKLGSGDSEGFAVVTVEPASGRFRRRAPRHRIVEQRNREFAPHILVVPVGSTVAFPNFDNVYHNVFSRSDAKPFDLGLYKSGQEREMQFDKEGIIRIGCNLHANMSAYVAVVSARHYFVTDSRGRFTFKSLDPGRYKLRAYSERSDEPATQTITIAPDRNTVSIALPAVTARGPLGDKFGAPRGQKGAR